MNSDRSNNISLKLQSFTLLVWKNVWLKTLLFGKNSFPLHANVVDLRYIMINHQVARLYGLEH